MFSLEELRAAHEVVLRTLRPTPAISWPLLGERVGAEVVVKHENCQPTGAFKVRGGLTYVDALMRRAPETKASSRRRAATTARASPSPVGAPASPSRSSCRTAIRARRTPPCARSARS